MDGKDYLFNIEKKKLDGAISDSDAIFSQILWLESLVDSVTGRTENGQGDKSQSSSEPDFKRRSAIKELIDQKMKQLADKSDDIDGINNYASEVKAKSRGCRNITLVESQFDESFTGEEILSLCDVNTSSDSSTPCPKTYKVPIKPQANFSRFILGLGEESDDELIEPDHKTSVVDDFEPRNSLATQVTSSIPFKQSLPDSTQAAPVKHERTNSLTSYPQFEQFKSLKQRQKNDNGNNRFKKYPKLNKYARKNYDDDESETSSQSPPPPDFSFQTASQVAGHIFQNRNGRNLGTGRDTDGTYGGNDRFHGSNGAARDGYNGYNRNDGCDKGMQRSGAAQSGNDVHPTIKKFIPPTKVQQQASAKGAPQVQKTSPETEYAWIFEDERIKTLEKNLVEKILSEIVQRKSNVSFDDIAGLESVKTRIRELVILPMLRPELFQGIRSPGKGVLLFGPPGTGKSMIGKCVASQSQATFFSISASVLTSKWVGDGEKMVRALFAVARILQPTVIFIDEIDSLLLQRNDQDHECSRRMKTEFLLQFDGMSAGEEDRLLVIGATNRPEGLDEAARRRFTSRLYIPLPSKEARIRIITTILKQNESNVTSNLSNEDLDTIAQQTDGYSGADMANLTKEAAMVPLRSAMAESSVLHVKLEDVRPICIGDFVKSLVTVKSSVSPSEIEHYELFNKTFGA